MAMTKEMPGESQQPRNGLASIRGWSGWETSGQRFLHELQERVDRAVLAAPQESFTPDKRAIVSHIRKKEAEREQFQDSPPDEKITLEGYTEHPWEVIIGEQSHYLALLRMGVQAVVHNLGEYRSEEYIEANARRLTKHELDHVTVALEEPELRVQYGIGFYRDRTGILGLLPFIVPEGRTTVGHYRKIHGATIDPSLGDRIITEDDGL